MNISRVHPITDEYSLSFIPFGRNMQLQNESYLQPSSLFARNFTGQETLIVYAIHALIPSPAQLHTPSIFYLFS